MLSLALYIGNVGNTVSYKLQMGALKMQDWKMQDQKMEDLLGMRRAFVVRGR